MSGWLYGQLLAAAFGEAFGTEDAAGPFSSGSTDLPGAVWCCRVFFFGGSLTTLTLLDPEKKAEKKRPYPPNPKHKRAISGKNKVYKTSLFQAQA